MPSLDRDWVLRTPLLKVMIRLGLPIAALQALHMAYNLTDLFWLGRLGGTALAAVSATWPVVFLVGSALVGVLQAGLALVSQYWGSRAYESALRAAGQLIFLSLALGIPLGLLAYLAIPVLMGLIGVPEEVLPNAVAYGRVFAVGIPAYASVEAAFVAFAAVGDTLTPTKAKAAGVLLNMVLDPIMIFGFGPLPRLEVAGAAIATVVSECAVALTLLRLLTGGAVGERLGLRHLRPHAEHLRRLMRTGLPLAVAAVSDAAGFTVLTGIISMMGATALAAWGVGDRPLGLIDVLVGGMLAATATVVGQSIGANMYDKARKAAVRSTAYAAAMTGAVVAALIALRREVAAFFSPADQEVVLHAAAFLLVMGPSVIFFVMLRAAFAVASGSGHTRTVMVLSVVRIWVLRNGLAYLLGPGPLGMGVTGLWLGMALSNVVTGTLALAWVLRGSWLRRAV